MPYLRLAKLSKRCHSSVTRTRLGGVYYNEDLFSE
jgi:hypothetical protein